MLKILQDKLQQYVNCEIPDVQAGFSKGRGTRDQIANICRIIKKAKELPQNIYFCFIDYTKAFDWITRNCGKFLKRWKYQITWPASWEIRMQVKKQQLELYLEQQTGSKSGDPLIGPNYWVPYTWEYGVSSTFFFPFFTLDISPFPSLLFYSLSSSWRYAWPKFYHWSSFMYGLHSLSNKDFIHFYTYYLLLLCI